jgi:hypothetical protein
MGKHVIIAVMVAALSVGSAHAAGLGDLARVVLGNGAVLQKGNDTCANKLSLASDEKLALSLARQAAQSVLPSQEFLSLDTSANAQAVTQAQSPKFCDRTAKRKNVMLDAVKKAGQKLVTARVLGL